MGVFINNEHHPTIFKNQSQMVSSNQNTYKIEYLSDWINNQKEINEDIQKLMTSLRKQIKKSDWIKSNQIQQLESTIWQVKEQNDKQNIFHTEQLKLLHDQLSEILVRVQQQSQSTSQNFNLFKEQIKSVELEQKRQQEFDQQVLSILQQLQNEQVNKNEWAKQEDEKHKRLNEQIEKIEALSQTILQHVEKNQALQEDLLEKTILLDQSHQTIIEKVEEQNQSHENLLERYENQEALIDKLLRQVDYMRSALFERTNYLSEKISNGFESIMNFFTRNKEIDDIHVNSNGKVEETEDEKELQ